jgi:hypothetical protein
VIQEMISFTHAQLNEDEAAANAATPGPWAKLEAEPVVAAPYAADNGHEIAEMAMCDEHPDRREADATHIARHDPARALREVEAKRSILAAHQFLELDGDAFCINCTSDLYERKGFDPCRTWRAIVSVYSDRPGFRPEWAA